MRHNPKRFAAPCLLATLITLGACSGEFKMGDLVGTYVLNTGSAKDTLELKSDGGYAHRYQAAGGPQETLTGKWQLDETLDGQVVTLDHFRPLPRENTSDSGYYILTPDRFFGSIRLIRNEDLGEFYDKQ